MTASLSRGLNAMPRAVALPTATASSKIALRRAPGLNGLPF